MINHLVTILCLIFPLAIFAQDVKSILGDMPQTDRHALESLFYDMMRTDNLSYTLFGDKPVSLSGDFILTPTGNIFAKHKCGGIFWKKWEVWKKYEHYFPTSNYLLIEEPSRMGPDVNDVVFINKRSFIKKVNHNIKLFKKILGSAVTAQNLLKQMEETHKFSSLIKNNEILWGVLLGYGLHNAQLYHERLKLEHFINFEQLPKIPLKKPLPSDPFTSIEEECEFLDSRLSLFGEHFYSPLVLRSVNFVADFEHPETKALEKKYHKLRGKISAIYAQGDFLEITLVKISQNQPLGDQPESATYHDHLESATWRFHFQRTSRDH